MLYVSNVCTSIRNDERQVSAWKCIFSIKYRLNQLFCSGRPNVISNEYEYCIHVLQFKHIVLRFLSMSAVVFYLFIYIFIEIKRQHADIDDKIFK